MNCECNVCMHGECYACLVGVATGPESHDRHCGARNRLFTDDGTAYVGSPSTTHRIYTDDDGERAYWECSCGCAGSADSYRVDLASDKHIGPNDRRIDCSSYEGILR